MDRYSERFSAHDKNLGSRNYSENYIQFDDLIYALELGATKVRRFGRYVSSLRDSGFLKSDKTVNFLISPAFQAISFIFLGPDRLGGRQMTEDPEGGEG